MHNSVAPLSMHGLGPKHMKGWGMEGKGRLGRIIFFPMGYVKSENPRFLNFTSITFFQANNLRIMIAE